MEWNALLNLFLIPIVGSIIVCLMPNSGANNNFTLQELKSAQTFLGNNLNREKVNIKLVGLMFSFLEFWEIIRIWIYMDESSPNFQFSFCFSWLSELFLIRFGLDGISIWFLLLTGLLIPICLLCSWDSIKIKEKEFIICFLLLELLLVGVFTVLDFLGFYILFEGVLIPMYLIIGVWGSERKEKIRAAYYFMFYTLLGSVMMLLSILYIYKETGTTDYLTLLSYEFDSEVQKIIFLGFFLSLAAKIPKFPFHVWLPLAHVEAPVSGSVMLAGILIKLGSYGFLRFTFPFFPVAIQFFTPLVFTLSILAIIYGSLTTLRQVDLKRIIAYSSISHMGVVMLGLFSLTVVGIEGSIILQIGHGLVSSALFILVTVLYDRHHSRIIKYYRGLTISMPLFSLLFFAFTMANIGVPLSINFVGEFTSLLGSFLINPFACFLASFGMVLSACYGLFLYNRIAFGTLSPSVSSSPLNRDLTRREFLTLFPLLFFTLLFGIKPGFILDSIHLSVLNIIT